MSFKYESQRKEQCVCYICWFSSFCSKMFFPQLQPIFPIVQEFSQGYHGRQRTTPHSFSTLPMIGSYQCCIQSLSFSQMFSYKPVPPRTLQSPKLMTTVCPLKYTDVRNCFTRFSTTYPPFLVQTHMTPLLLLLTSDLSHATPPCYIQNNSKKKYDCY